MLYRSSLIEANTITGKFSTSAIFFGENFQEPQNSRHLQLLLRDISTSISAKRRNFLHGSCASRHFFSLADPTEDLATHFFAVHPCRSRQISLITQIASHELSESGGSVDIFRLWQKKKKSSGRSGRPTTAGINVCFVRRALIFFFFSSLRRQYFSMCTPNCGPAVTFSPSQQRLQEKNCCLGFEDG